MKKPHVNKPCPCGSGIKYKKCCGHPTTSKSSDHDLPHAQLPQNISLTLKQITAKEVTRKQQQGLGKPIIATQFKDHLAVGVGNQLFLVPKGKTFPDFLTKYLPSVMGRDWFVRELKNAGDHHPIAAWYTRFCKLQKKHFPPGQDIASMPETGLTNCFLGLAYSLYLLQHNVELQKRYIDRLKDRNNFQGAYYELLVANCLIRSGFELALEDESDESQKHCEFSAVSKATNKKYWVEAKARAVAGVLCKTHLNGTPNKDATSSLSEHISEALRKPAAESRLIFVDVNAVTDPAAKIPNWVERAERKLKSREKNRKDHEVAYIFITNMNFHLHLEDENRPHGILAYGLGISDFGKSGHYTFRELYSQKKKHADAYRILHAFGDYPKIPSTVDGTLPSETFSSNPRHIKIGATYLFEEIGEATVTSATVDESTATLYVGTSKGNVLTRKLEPAELADYRRHKDTFFGILHEQGRRAHSAYEHFEHLVEIHLKHPEESILNKIAAFPDASDLRKLSHEERVIIYCERLAASLARSKT